MSATLIHSCTVALSQVNLFTFSVYCGYKRPKQNNNKENLNKCCSSQCRTALKILDLHYHRNIYGLYFTIPKSELQICARYIHDGIFFFFFSPSFKVLVVLKLTVFALILQNFSIWKLSFLS